MALPKSPIVMTPAQVEDLSRRLSQLRHNVNNHLSLIVAAAELIKRKPEMAPKMMDSLVDQPQKIVDEVRKFSDELNHALGIQRD